MADILRVTGGGWKSKGLIAPFNFVESRNEPKLIYLITRISEWGKCSVFFPMS